MPLGLAAALVLSVLAASPASATRAAADPVPDDPADAARWTAVSTSAASDEPPRLSAPHTCGVTVAGALACWGHDEAMLGRAGNRTLHITPMQVGTATNWATVAAGREHTCALNRSAALWCWGENYDGQVGDGTRTDRFEPVKVLGPRRWTSVDATYSNTCAITDDGDLWCWGANDAGQLGDGTRDDRPIPKQIAPELDWIAVAVGSAERRIGKTHGHTCGVATDRTLWCWGDNDAGQLGLRDDERRLRPTQVGTDTDWAGVTTAAHASCATKTDGSAWCWGINKSGRIGDGTEINRDEPVQVGAGAEWVTLDAGRSHTCGIQVDQSAWCWGRNATGQLGDGTISKHTVPTAVLGGFPWATVSVAYTTTCGVTVDGTGICWGEGNGGQRGDGTLSTARAPSQERAILPIGAGPWQSRWTSLAGGSYLGCGIVQDGRGACWSDFRIGELRSGGRYAQPIHDSWTWDQLSGGHMTVCGVRDDGALFCGGEPPPGGTDTPLRRIGTESSWRSVNVGYSHACALQDDDSLWCWGDNDYGQVGVGDQSPRPDPVRIEGSWSFVATGDWTTCGIQTDGSLWCWGENNYGQLGLGESGAPVLEPRPVGDRTDWRTVSGGDSFTCGTTTGDEAYCWGYNHFGQLGDGTRITRKSPVPVVGPADWQVVIGENGENFNCGLRLDGTAWCWGQNDGRFGSGGSAHSTRPVPVAGGHTFTDLTLVDRGGCATTASGEAWCWGRFEGDGTIANHLEPAPLLSVRGL